MIVVVTVEPLAKTGTGVTPELGAAYHCICVARPGEDMVITPLDELENAMRSDVDGEFVQTISMAGSLNRRVSCITASSSERVSR